MDKPIRIIVTDDHLMFADGVKQLLDMEPGLQVVAIASSGNELLNLLKQEPADLVLLDLSMPGMSGLETSRILLKEYPQLRVLVVTMHNTDDKIMDVLEEGVHGYILKNAGRQELIHAIRMLMEGKQYYSADIVAKMMANHKRQKEVTPILTKREKEILQLIYKGFSTPEIADKLFISPHTVDTHRKNLLSKTETHNSAQLVHYAINKGWIEP